MATVNIEHPEIITVSFRQERGDRDYGSCLWARFNFDRKNYFLSIESDCGSYSNGWYPTPETESFMHLCARFDWLYLVDKISTKSVVDGDATYKSLMAFLEDYDEYGYELLSNIQVQEIEEACHSNRNDHAVLAAIQRALEDTPFDGSCSEYDIACIIENDYPRGAKKIADIFRDYIQPVVKKIVEDE